MYSKVGFLFCLVSVHAAPQTYDQSQNGELNVQVDLKDLKIFALMNGQREEYYEDIDYAYDYSEMTIKPQGGTSKKPLNTTTANPIENATIATTMNVLGDTTEPPKNNTQDDTTLANDIPTTVKSETIISPNNITLKSNIASVLQSRKEDVVTTIGKNNTVIATESTTIINDSDPVTQKPQSLMMNISSIKNEVETTTKSGNIVGSHVPTKLSATNSSCKKGFVLNQRVGCDLKLQSMSNALLKIVKLSQKLKSRRHRRNHQDSQ